MTLAEHAHHATNFPVAFVVGTVIAVVLIYLFGRTPPGGPGRKEHNTQ